MKALFYLLTCATLFLTACNGNNANKAEKDANTQKTAVTDNLGAAITFDEKVHDFGEIVQGEKVEYAFKFTNTGKGDVVILDAGSSCGCTVPEWPKDPIKPGQSAYVKVIFDSAGKEGYTQKEVTLRLNDGQGYQVGPIIRCNIIRK
ncbi:DUF1573 domain-containing protein [Chitinophaga sp. Cy-1792]|uniref:DUF1573 domain-containing protein n=1 Tax=Chitinophaga sp. Cy-1792 TaxID=2608339 RepID=UPI0014236845|nr:DUF1573 domain-containing protein [Chitinophaga sp. Cy-1792]NIG57676.1 DUF1573 domain-containing protein [Chitinophaga sp. Cy-1792]